MPPLNNCITSVKNRSVCLFGSYWIEGEQLAGGEPLGLTGLCIK